MPNQKDFWSIPSDTKCIKEKDFERQDDAFDLASNQCSRLLVDISELVQYDAGSGIQRVTKSIMSIWMQNPPRGFDVVPVYFYNGSYLISSCFLKNVHGDKRNVIRDEMVLVKKGDIFLGLDLNFAISSYGSIFKDWREKGVKICFMVYDLLPLLHQEMFDKELSAAFKKWLEVVIEVSDQVICISHTVSGELIDYIDRNRVIRSSHLEIFWTHLGADVTKNRAERNVSEGDLDRLTFLKSRPCFLKVATLEPRKCHLQVLEAFEYLWSRNVDINLVFVGKEGWKVRGLVDKLYRHPEKGNRLFWLEGLSDGLLETVYSSSTCLIMASIGEGFGLPLIEAAKFKLPIIARDIPVFREVVGEHAYYFSGMALKNIADAVSEWLALYKVGDIPSSSKISWQTWEQSAKKLSEILIYGQMFNS